MIGNSQSLDWCPTIICCIQDRLTSPILPPQNDFFPRQPIKHPEIPISKWILLCKPYIADLLQTHLPVPSQKRKVRGEENPRCLRNLAKTETILLAHLSVVILVRNPPLINILPCFVLGSGALGLQIEVCAKFRPHMRWAVFSVCFSTSASPLQVSSAHWQLATLHRCSGRVQAQEGVWPWMHGSYFTRSMAS